jgi:hypothetical protein
MSLNPTNFLSTRGPSTRPNDEGSLILAKNQRSRAALMLNSLNPEPDAGTKC